MDETFRCISSAKEAPGSGLERTVGRLKIGKQDSLSWSQSSTPQVDTWILCPCCEINFEFEMPSL